MSWFLVLILCEGAACGPSVLPAAYIKKDDCIAAGEQATKAKGIKRFHCVAYSKVN